MTDPLSQAGRQTGSEEEEEEWMAYGSGKKGIPGRAIQGVRELGWSSVGPAGRRGGGGRGSRERSWGVRLETRGTNHKGSFMHSVCLISDKVISLVSWGGETRKNVGAQQ